MKIGIAGCRGKMGLELIKQLVDDNEVTISGGLERANSKNLGEDLLENISTKKLGVKVTDDPLELFNSSDVVIDFSIPETTVNNAETAAKTNTALVIGTTGFSDEQLTKILEYSLKTPILKAANMSLGVNLLLSLVTKAAKALDEDFDIEILEMHHNRKIDAPSGTALALGEAAAKGKNKQLKDVITTVDRKGARERGTIGFAVLRGGGVVGDHDVIFAGEEERIVLSHKASSRAIFAKGAIKAAKWLYNKPSGLYGMNDVLGLSS